MRRFVRWLSWLALFLIIGFLGWGSYYICNHGFSRHWRLRVSQEFRKRGLDLYVHRLTLDPIQGFVAREVQIFDANDPNRVLATIDRVDLDINLTNLLHSRPFIDAVDMRNAALSLPVNPNDPHADRLQISQLNARIILPPHEWYVSEAEAMIYGIRVSARGRLQNPEAFQASESATNDRQTNTHTQFAFDLLKDLATLHYGAAAPSIEITFGGDLADQHTLYANASIWGQGIRRGPSELSQVYAALSLRDNVIELKQGNISDAHGEMDINGSYALGTGVAAIEMRSSLAPGNLAHFLKMDKLVEGSTFPTAPNIALSGSGTIRGDQVTALVTGHASAGRFLIKGAQFSGAGGDFAWDGSRWYLRNGWVQNASGRVGLRAMWVPGQFRARLDSDLNPNSLALMLSGPAADAMRDWDFQESPRIGVEITGTSIDPASWETHGTVSVGRTWMRGVPLNKGTANVDAKGMLFTYRDFNLQRDEGGATGTFAYDFDKHEAWLTNVHTHLNTIEAAEWIDPGLPRQLAPYRFKSAPDVTLNGFVQCANDKGTHLDVHVNAPHGMEYAFCKRDLSFSGISGDVLFRDHEILLKDVAGNVLGGAIHGGADIRFGQNSPGYKADVDVNQVDFASLTKLYFNYANSHGLLSGTYSFGGANDDPWTLYGNGGVEITDGNVFAIPVLGPFSGILNTMVPGMGYNVAHDGKCTFAVRDGVITTHDFLVKGEGFSMIGDGRLLFLDDKLNFNIRLNAQGLPGVFLFPVSKLLAYAGTGSLENPVWKPILLEGAKRQ
jgi:hypothetical protein